MIQFTDTLRRNIVLSLLLLVTGHVYGQDFKQTITDKLRNYRNLYPNEKAYIHTDKPYYASGDTLWFKAYLVEGSLHLADSASNVLYVDLIHQKSGKNIVQRRIQLEAGLGHGSFTLADSIPSGAYTLRAYTYWMRNFPDDFLFKKDVYIFENQEHNPPTASDAFDVTFFPEGGQMVDGVNTRVAFKAVNGSGLGVDVSGFIFNEKNDTVSALKSEHLGLGRFPFVPKKGEQYTASLRTKNGSFQRFTLPVINDFGYTMIVENLTSASRMRVIVYGKHNDVTEKPVYIVGHSRGTIAFAAKGNVSSKGLMMNIPTTELPDGIMHLTLFNDQNQPVAERLAFINHNRSLRVKITTPKAAYLPREKTQIEIMVTDSAGKPAEANLSVAVTDASQVSLQPNDMNMISYMLLSSDLKGFVEQPSYYFDPANTERKIHLDYLMMTQGWRRFAWQDVLADSLPSPKRFVEQGITVRGEVKRGNRKMAEHTMLSVFLSNDSLKTFITTQSDEHGFFTLHNLVFADTMQLRLQGMSKNSSNLNFSLFPPDIPASTPVKIPFYPITVSSEQLKASLKRAEEYQEIERKIKASREKLLQAVTIKAKKEVVRDTRKIYSNADATIKVTPQIASGAMSVLDLIGGRVAGVRVVGSGMNASVSIRNGGEPLYVLDGMPVEKDFVVNISVHDVESVDVLKGASAVMYGSRGGNGVIAIYTKRGDVNYDYTQEIIPGVLVAKIAGFNHPREFYAPKYDVKSPDDLRPDYRSTIFWLPQIKTGRDGKAKFEYYNTDSATNVDICTEVLSPGGEPGFAHAVYRIE